MGRRSVPPVRQRFRIAIETEPRRERPRHWRAKTSPRPPRGRSRLGSGRPVRAVDGETADMTIQRRTWHDSSGRGCAALSAQTRHSAYALGALVRARDCVLGRAVSTNMTSAYRQRLSVRHSPRGPRPIQVGPVGSADANLNVCTTASTGDLPTRNCILSSTGYSHVASSVPMCWWSWRARGRNAPRCSCVSTRRSSESSRRVCGSIASSNLCGTLWDDGRRSHQQSNPMRPSQRSRPCVVSTSQRR